MIMLVDGFRHAFLLARAFYLAIDSKEVFK